MRASQFFSRRSTAAEDLLVSPEIHLDMGRPGLAIPPPRTEDELRERAAWLAGRTVGELAAALGVVVPPRGARGKGKVGDLVEKALGGESGSAPAPDFARLGIEL